MKKLTLRNGLTVIIDRRASDTTTLMLTVKVGSIYESEANNGMSHFIEHAVFSGTRNYSALEIAKQIEILGGELNAGTTAERTFFYVKILPKHIATALRILSELVFLPSFNPEQLETEKRVVAEEISYIYDDYSFYQWVLFQNNLFEGPQKKSVFGSVEKLMSFSRDDVLSFHRKFYLPKNMLLVVTGNVPSNTIKIIARFFSYHSDAELPKLRFEEPQQRRKEITVNLATHSAYLVLGYKVPAIADRDAIYFDIFYGVLGRGQSGWLFDEIRNKLGLAYSVGAYHYKGTKYNFFAVYANLSSKNIVKVKQIFVKQLSALKHLSVKELQDAKSFLEGNFSVSNDEPLNWAHTLTQWEMASQAEEALKYREKLKNITLTQVRNAAVNYLTKEYCSIAILPLDRHS